MGVSKRRKLGWAIAIAAVSAPTTWAADAPPPLPAFALRAAAPRAYKLEVPRVLLEARGPFRLEIIASGARLKESPSRPDLLLTQGLWFLDARPSFGGEPFYSLEEQVSYYVAHAPSLVVKLPDAFVRSTPQRLELATLELHLPF